MAKSGRLTDLTNPPLVPLKSEGLLSLTVLWSSSSIELLISAGGSGCSSGGDRLDLSEWVVETEEPGELKIRLDLPEWVVETEEPDELKMVSHDEVEEPALLVKDLDLLLDVDLYQELDELFRDDVLLVLQEPEELVVLQLWSEVGVELLETEEDELTEGGVDSPPPDWGNRQPI